MPVTMSPESSKGLPFMPPLRCASRTVTYCSMVREIMARAIHWECRYLFPSTNRMATASITRFICDSMDTMSGGKYLSDMNFSTVANMNSMLIGDIFRRDRNLQHLHRAGHPPKHQAAVEPPSTEIAQVTSNTEEKAYGKSGGASGPSTCLLDLDLMMTSFALSTTKARNAPCCSSRCFAVKDHHFASPPAEESGCRWHATSAATSLR
mmetsp:Transcript_60918/g.181495  ORF Transcript_60918/g.181495 Transcript_60918/m.181495 type:complete len:208 (+) Transcript_60918:314-937(+)